MVLLKTAGSSIAIDDLYVTDKPNPFSAFLGSKKPMPPAFPSGIQELYITINFKPPPPDGTRLTADVVGSKGAVPLETTASITSRVENSVTVNMPLKPASGKFEDGPYQATLLINGVPYAQLNWTVGSQ